MLRYPYLQKNYQLSRKPGNTLIMKSTYLRFHLLEFFTSLSLCVNCYNTYYHELNKYHLVSELKRYFTHTTFERFRVVMNHMLSVGVTCSFRWPWPQSAREAGQLVCRLAYPSLPHHLLAPLLLEEVSRRPHIVLIHHFLTRNQTRRLAAAATPKVFIVHCRTFQHYTSREYSNYRVFLKWLQSPNFNEPACLIKD